MHPPRVSAPMTCAKIDFIGSVLYGACDENLQDVVTESVRVLAQKNASEHATMLGDMMRSPHTPPDAKRAIFFLVLNKDSALREKITGICPYKAAAFYEALHRHIVPAWLKDETKTLYDRVEALRDAYRNS